MQNDYMLSWRYWKLILISAQRHQMISFPSWQTQSAAGIVYLALSLLDALHRALHAAHSTRVNSKVYVVAFILRSANMLYVREICFGFFAKDFSFSVIYTLFTSISYNTGINVKYFLKHLFYLILYHYHTARCKWRIIQLWKTH